MVDGRPVTGATGAASEFGHLPFGDRRTRCQCGARGCWQMVLGVRALAATLGEPETVDPREFAQHVLALAAQDSPAGERAAEVVVSGLDDRIRITADSLASTYLPRDGLVTNA